MGKSERKAAVLESLEETGLELPWKVLYENLKYRGYRFSSHTVRNHLRELVNEGAIEEQQVSEVDGAERKYYRAAAGAHNRVIELRSNNRAKHYGSNWQEQRQKTLERDGHRCRVCGYDPEGDNEGLDLHVHHIEKRRTFDDLEEANRLSNLVTLCASCHPVWEHKSETQLRARVGMFLEGSE